MEINQKVKLLRKEKGLNGLTCSKEMGISSSTLHDIESGKFIPSSKIIITICKFFNVSSDWLLGLKEERY